MAIIHSLLFILGQRILPQARYTAREISPETKNEGSLYFFRPVAIVCDEKNIFVLDSEDEAIRVFSKSGSLVYSFGRKGQGPGEFQMPADIDILGGKVYVADGGNRRIQVLDRRGRYLAGFKVPFWPQKILALDEERIVVGHIPSGLSGAEKVLHCYDSNGKLRWEAAESYFSGDSVYDMMRNRLFIERAPAGEFFLVRSSHDRVIRRLDKDGALVKETEVAGAYAVSEVEIPARGGKKRLLGFCWNFAAYGGKVYLLIPEPTPEKDLGPGRRVAVIEAEGSLEAFLDFPLEITRIAVEGERVYAVDTEARLRLFSIEK
jgi:hypothetical protein